MSCILFTCFTALQEETSDPISFWLSFLVSGDLAGLFWLYISHEALPVPNWPPLSPEMPIRNGPGCHPPAHPPTTERNAILSSHPAPHIYTHTQTHKLHRGCLRKGHQVVGAVDPSMPGYHHYHPHSQLQIDGHLAFSITAFASLSFVYNHHLGINQVLQSLFRYTLH